MADPPAPFRREDPVSVAEKRLIERGRRPEEGPDPGDGALLRAPREPAGAELAGPGAVLWRQRTAGNAAVVRSLGLGGVLIQRLVVLTPEDEAAIVEQLHDAMAGWGTDEEAIYVVLQKLGKDAAAIGKLKAAYKAKYGDDLEAELRSEMSGSELKHALELIGIVEDPGKGPAMGGAAPTTPDQLKAAAKRLYAAMKGWGTDEEEVYAVLTPFNRDPAGLATLKSTYDSELSGGLTGKGLEEDIKDEMSSDELSYALYLLNAPPPRAPSGSPAVDPGTVVHTGAVPGGTVTVRTDVQSSAGKPKEGFSMEYEGGLSSDTAWLQFIWREVVVEHPVRGEYRLNDPITTSGGHYNLTDDPSSPNYNTDSNKPDDPFYEAGFRHDRTADSSTMLDLPGSLKTRVQAQFAGGATKVTSRAHFNTYLIRDNKAIYHVGLDVEWVFTSAVEPPRTQSVRSGGKVDRLPEGMRKRLIDQRPRFEYIQ